jgi:hypothetical protein
MTPIGAQVSTAPAPLPQTPRSTLPTPRTGSDQPAPVANTNVSPRREPGGQAVNVKVEVTISDQRVNGVAPKKTVTVVTGDQLSGFIRTQTLFPGIGDVPLNVDAEPHILPDGKIRLRLNLQYDLPSPAGGGGADTQGSTNTQAARALKTSIRENLAIVLENGKALVVAQSADPVSDRQVTVEVKASILR